MSIDKQYLIGKTEKFLKTSSGRKKLKEHGVTVVTAKEARTQANKMRDILYKHIVAVIPSFKPDDIVVGKPNPQDNYSVKVSFKEEALRRDSLLNASGTSKYRGVDDIVLHFTYGWHAKGTAFGCWNKGGGSSRFVSSRTDYPGNPFLTNAVQEFNLSAPEGMTVNAKLIPGYMGYRQTQWEK